MASSSSKQSSLAYMETKRRYCRKTIITWLCLTAMSWVEVAAKTEDILSANKNEIFATNSSMYQSTSVDDRQARTTGETILDLVNSVLEKNREAFRANGSSSEDTVESARLSISDGFLNDAEAQDVGNSMQWVENDRPSHSVNTSASGDESRRLSRMSHTTTTTVISTDATPVPIVLELQPDNQSEPSADLTTGDELVSVTQQELDDRHIPYDVIAIPAPQSINFHKEDYRDEPRLSNYKRLGSVDWQDDQQENVSNYTLIKVVGDASKNQTSENSEMESGFVSNQTAAGRSGGVQARSMQGALTTRAVPQQISRPPYASYDHFSGESMLHRRAAAALDVAGTGDIKSNLLEQQAERRSSNSSGTEGTGGSAGLEFKINMTSDVVNSINRISSHLNEDAANSRSSSSNIPVDSNGLSASMPINSGSSLYDEDSEVKQQLQNLAPVSQPIDLSPIPAVSRGQASSDQLYSGNLLLQQSGHNNDRYSDNRSRSPQDKQEVKQQQALEEQRLNGGSGDTSTLHQEGSTRRFGLHESMQQQLQELLSAQQGEISSHRMGGHSGTPHAASFINVTAPITPPLSASNVIDSPLGDQVATKSLMQQSGGLNRSKQPTDMNTKASSSKRQTPSGNNLNGPNGPTGNSNFASQQVGLSTTSTTLEPLYSQPANQLVSMSGSLSNKSTLGDYQSDEDRFRADGAAGEMLAGRGSPVHHAPHYVSNLNSPNHNSGYRQPQISSWPASLPSGYLGGSNSMQLSSKYAQRVGASTKGVNNSATATGTTQSPLSVAASTIGSTNGFITTGTASTASLDMISSSISSAQALSNNSTVVPTVSPAGPMVPAVQSGGETPSGQNRRVLNLTRVEHISAECSNDLIKTVIVFNGTFNGIIYSSGYVRDPNCVYITGANKTRYEFSIKLNQCGTLGRQEIHNPNGFSEVRRRDQVMWNTLSIQYNPIIEQEWDEHFRVSCEYGSDFWKTISFSPFNVETNTGAPVVFTVDPPHCHMEILRGHGMVGPRQEATSGPVTVGDPLTLLIHMKSEKAGFDILVKNCVAHNGGRQRMQLIDSNGCVVNERFISPFRGTYNNDHKHVTLYSYLKAFRFTGSPVLYLECEIHMCQNNCPPQMCYWRRLSKRSANETLLAGEQYIYEDDETESFKNSEKETRLRNTTSRRHARALEFGHRDSATSNNDTSNKSLSERVSLFQALEVHQGHERDPEAGLVPNQGAQSSDETAISSSLLCYRRFEVLGFLFTTGSLVLASICLSIGCCWRAASLRRTQAARLAKFAFGGQSAGSHLAINVNQGQLSPSSSSANSSPPITTTSSPQSPIYHLHSSNKSYLGRQAQQSKHHLYHQASNLASLYEASPTRHKERPFLAHY